MQPLRVRCITLGPFHIVREGDENILPVEFSLYTHEVFRGVSLFAQLSGYKEFFSACMAQIRTPETMKLCPSGAKHTNLTY